MSRPLAKGRALLVDDEDYVRLATADMLAELGYEVVETASAEVAVSLLDDDLLVDVVVTDHLMPGMSGADLAHVLHQRDPALPVLIVSGDAESDGVRSDLPR